MDIGAVTVRRTLFATLGMILVALGVIGVFLPGLPTTEFLLAASYLFARSSPALQDWLDRNRWLGPPLRRVRETRGMPRRSKALALAWMWTGLGISVPALASVGLAAQMAALAFGVAGTATILFLVRTTAPRQPRILVAESGAGPRALPRG
jgi:uncharacterized membrane protein YbaN (DUF454 family)